MRPRVLISAALCLFFFASATGQSEFVKAEKLLNLKAFDLAIKNYESALAKYPDNAEGFAQLGEAYMMTNQLLEALKSYEKAFAINDKLDSNMTTCMIDKDDTATIHVFLHHSSS